MKDENVYRKLDDGSFAPFGVQTDRDYLPDGVWFIRHRDHGYSLTNLDYLSGVYHVGDPKKPDMEKLREVAGYEDIVDRVTESPMWKEQMHGYGMSLMDAVRTTIMYLRDTIE